MSNGNLLNLTKLKNGGGDHGSCLPDSDSSSVGTGSELADRDHDLDDAGLGPGVTHLTPADLERAEKLQSKKTKGRVKIKMEFIDNKLRRYTTFSKRKTGIMKKAYELSTLTGTQVMLLVASETGHVYTFATRKLQPMITSESGKALIQTCLNSPDIPSDSHHHSNPDQRMCATGFEETELSYQVSDEEALNEGKSSLFTVTNIPGAGADAAVNTSSSTGLPLSGTGHTYPMTTYLPTTSATAQAAPVGKVNTSLASGMPMSVAQTPSLATLLSTGQALTGQALTGQALQTAGVLQVQQNPSQLQLQAGAQAQTPAAAATPTFYRLPQGATLTGAASQMVTALVPSVPVAATSATTQPSQNTNTVAMLTAPQSTMSPAGGAGAIATPLMYHAHQGLVYAASPAGAVNTLPEGFVFNYQTATPAHVHQTSQANIEGSSTSAVAGAVPSAIPVHLHVASACQQGTTITSASNAAASPSLPSSSSTSLLTPIPAKRSATVAGLRQDLLAMGMQKIPSLEGKPAS